MAAKLRGETAEHLRTIALEAPGEDVAAAAVVLGRKAGDGRQKLLREIAGAQAPARVKAAANLQLTIQNVTDRDRRDTKQNNIAYDIRHNGLNRHDVLVSIPNAADFMNRVLMLLAVLDACDEPDREALAWLHRLLADMPDIDEAGVALSFLLAGFPNSLIHEITREESNRLRKIYDGDADAKKRLILYFDPDDRGYTRIPHAYSPCPYQTLVSLWAHYNNDPMYRWLADLYPMLRYYNYHVDVRNKAAAEIDAEAQETLDALGISAADIPDGVLLKAMEFHMTLPLKYLHEHGKKEFIEQRFSRRIATSYKSFDPEDDRFHTEETITVLYGDPADESDTPLRA